MSRDLAGVALRYSSISLAHRAAAAIALRAKGRDSLRFRTRYRTRRWAVSRAGRREQSLARTLYRRLEEYWLLIADRNFFNWADWCAAADSGGTAGGSRPISPCRSRTCCLTRPIPRSW